MIHSIIQYLVSISDRERPVWLHVFKEEMFDALDLSIDTKQHDIVRQLTTLVLSHYEYCRYDYARWLIKAVDTKDVEMVNLILDLEVEATLDVDRGCFGDICFLGNVQIMRKLLNKGILRLRDPAHDPWRTEIPGSHPVDLAIADGTPEILTAVLETFSEYEMRLGTKTYGILVPFRCAIYFSKAYAVETLLERAETLHHVELPYEAILQVAADLKQETIFDIIRKHAIAAGKYASDYASARTGKVTVKQ
ncbi:uncharacterized protein EI97DRAFT_459234 [Westerdykella ornata]|uniref:Ankyrin n=1 Tax=Westerdykella ornata TaxID=318751 RepID=A0A6A6JFJ3_WESOR|nr:uncharacterized protein EI97DRAFT_459234 [Westerdykella ornata]KAF2275321.1 hypothetical protein EI97DRAFT_459234 [Westerdykella ornata]